MHFSAQYIKFFLFPLLMVSMASATEGTLSYNIKPVKILEDKPALEISIRIEHAASETILRIPHANVPFDEVYGGFQINVSGKKEVSIGDIEDGRISLFHEPSDPLVLKYTFFLSESTPVNNPFFPTVEDGATVFTAENMFFMPIFSEKEDPAWTVRWTFEDSEHLFYLPDNNREEMQVSISSFHKKLFYLGDKAPLQFKVNGEPIDLVTLGDRDWGYIQEGDWMHLIQPLIEAQRQFWGTKHSDPYLIILKKSSLRRVAGAHFHNGFFMYAPKIPKKIYPLVMHVISHELFHAWLGTKIGVRRSDRDLIWFMEGLTDYYADRFLQSKNLLMPDEVLELRKILIERGEGFKKTLPEDFLKEPEFGDFIVYKGHCWFDYFESISDKATIDRIMREAAAYAEMHGGFISEAAIEGILYKNLGLKMTMHEYTVMDVPELH